MITLGMEPSCISKILRYDHERTFYNKRSELRRKLNLSHGVPLENYLNEQSVKLLSKRKAYLNQVMNRY